MKRNFCLTYWIYTPLLAILMIPTVYLSFVAYSASFTPGDDCSFIGLFVGLGIIFAVACGIVTLIIVSKWLFRKTEKKVFLIPCIFLGAASAFINYAIGKLLFGGSSEIVEIGFMVMVACSVVCIITDIFALLRKTTE